MFIGVKCFAPINFPKLIQNQCSQLKLFNIWRTSVHVYIGIYRQTYKLADRATQRSTDMEVVDGHRQTEKGVEIRQKGPTVDSANRKSLV